MSFIPPPLRIPAFRAYFVARLASTIAQMAMVIVIGWQVYDIARQSMDVKDAALRLGMIGVVQFVPLFALSLVAGWTADRVDRRFIARGAVALELFCAATLAVVTLSGAMSLYWLYGVPPCSGSRAPSPGRRWARSPPTSCPRKILPNAIALSSIAWQVGHRRRPGDRRLSLRRRPGDALCRQRIAVRRVADRPVPDPRGGPPGARQRGQPVGRGRRRPRLRPPQPARARRDQPRSVRRPARRRDRDAADLRARHPPAGPEGLGHLRAAPAVGATLTARVVRVPATQEQCRGQDARRGRGVRRRDGGVRPVALDALEPRLPVPARRRRHAVGLCPPVADPALYPGCDARPRRRGLDFVHLRLERAWRGRERLPCRLGRAGRRRGRRRHRRDHRGWPVGMAISRVAPCTQLQGPQCCRNARRQARQGAAS